MEPRAFLCMLVFAVPACTDPPEEPSPPVDHGRGTLVTDTPIDDLDQERIIDDLGAFGLEPDHVRFDVQTYQLEYDTIDADGEPTTASAFVALPVGGDGDLQLVTWLHGTRVYRGEVASVDPRSDDRAFVSEFASAGYAVCAPDYLGLGTSPGLHPWMDPDTAATASVDALRAMRTFAEREGRPLDERVLVTGFSQGGNSAMALGRALAQGAYPDLELGALAPISGGYGWSGWVDSAIEGDVEPLAATIYLAYLTVAWNRLHGLYGVPSEAFRAPYDLTMETLFDNDHTIQEIFPAVPATPDALLTSEFALQLQEPAGSLAAAFDAADGVCDWLPDVPVTLYAAGGDHEMPIASTHHCLGQLQAVGADVELIDVGDVDHFGSEMESVPRILAQFEAL